MSNYDIINENDEKQVEMVELSDEAMEAVAGGNGRPEIEIEIGVLFKDNTFNIGQVNFLFDFDD